MKKTKMVERELVKWDYLKLEGTTIIGKIKEIKWFGEFVRGGCNPHIFNGFKFESVKFPQLGERFLCVHGSQFENDGYIVSHTYKTEAKAQKVLNILCNLSYI